MKFLALAACCSLIAFAVVNLGVSALVAAFWRVRRASRPGTSGGSLLFLRVLPAAFSTAFVVLAFVPAFLRHEPRDSTERVNLWVAAAAAAGLAIFAVGLIRAASATLRTRRLVRGWRRVGRPIRLPGWAGPAYSVDAPIPGAFVAGYLRPTLFLARRVEAVCTEAELAAIVAHERAHVSAWDNLKKLVVRCLPDVLGLMPASQAIERAWYEAVEDEADDAALDNDAAGGIELASAILKVSRLSAAALPPAISSSLNSGGPVTRRVLRLVRRARPRAGLAGWWAWAPRAGVVVTPVGLALHPELSVGLHRITEAVVRILTGS